VKLFEELADISFDLELAKEFLLSIESGITLLRSDIILYFYKKIIIKKIRDSFLNPVFSIYTKLCIVPKKLNFSTSSEVFFDYLL